MKLEVILNKTLWNLINPCWDKSIENSDIGWKPREDIIIMPIITHSESGLLQQKAFLVQVESYEPFLQIADNVKLIVEDNGNTYIIKKNKITAVNSNVRMLKRKCD